MKIGQTIGQRIRKKIGQLRNDLGLSSDADQDASQRGARRNRGAAITGGTAVLARAVQVSTSLITIPLTVHYLGNERFGLWMTISSVFAMANFADFGIGNGVLNTVADAFGKNDFDRIRAAISSGFAVLGAVGLLLLGLFASTFAWVSWADVFRVTSAQARAEAAPALMVFACCFALNIPLDLVQRAQLGLAAGLSHESLAGRRQSRRAGRRHRRNRHALLSATPCRGPCRSSGRGHCPSTRFIFLSSAGPICGPVVASCRADASLASSLSEPCFCPSTGGGRRIFRRQHHHRPHPGSLERSRLLHPATHVLSDFPDGRHAGHATLARLRRSHLARRYPMGPPNSPAFVGLVFGFAAVASITMLLIAHRLLAWWIGPRISPPFLLLLGLALWTIVECCGSALAMFLSGASIMRFQIVVASIFGVTCLAAKVDLTARYGIVAVPWATFIAYLSIVLLSCAIYVPRALKHLHAPPIGSPSPLRLIED